jgi:LPS-assembly protein
MDATITPRVLSKRGLMLGSEFRFLSEKQSGQIYAEYINDSNYDNDREPIEVLARGTDISHNRGAFSAQHLASLSPDWKSKIDFNYVSDNYYIDDFGNNLTDRSESHLLREGKVYYSNSYINFSARVQGYQELKENVNTYSRLPQFLLSGYNLYEPGDIPIGLGFTSEAVSFAKNWDYDRDADEGQRFNVRPYIEMPYNRQYGYIKPKLSFDLINYSLNDTKINGADSNFNRATPIVSIDSGLYFEKELSLFNTGLTQTLEPRLYYLYVPYRDQNLNPLFDTSSNTFSFDQLFRDNRFSGVDRIGDANQLTYALTSRFYDNENGFERFRASLGQVVYFQNRDVQLRAFNEDDETASSAIAAEVASEFLPSWNTSFSMLYDPHNSVVDTSNLRLQYKSDAYHILNLDYTFKNDGTIKENYEQIDVSAYWKIAPKWRALAQYNYSLQDSFNLESMVGIEYDSCCYALRLVVGREQAYNSEDSDLRVMLQMQFKGLASLGNISDKLLSNDIRGFENIMSE